MTSIHVTFERVERDGRASERERERERGGGGGGEEREKRDSDIVKKDQQYDCTSLDISNISIHV